MMFDKCKNSQAQGNIGLGLAIAWFTANQFTVSLPLNDSQEYDLIVENDGNLKKVQVKTARNKSKIGSYKVELRSRSYGKTAKQFDSSTVDFLFVLTSDGSKYLIPRSQIKSVRSIELGKAKYRAWLLPALK